MVPIINTNVIIHHAGLSLGKSCICVSDFSNRKCCCL